MKDLILTTIICFLPPLQQQKTKGGKRKPQSTPSSPSRSRELQCTCMTAENLHRARNGRVRYTGAATLPRVQPRSVDDYKISYSSSGPRPPSSSSAAAANDTTRRGATTTASVHSKLNTAVKTSLQERISDVGASYHQHQHHHTQQRQQLYAAKQAKSIDCGLRGQQSGHQHNSRTSEDELLQRNKSKSSDNVFEQSAHDVPGLSLDSDTLKRMLHPLAPAGRAGDSAHSSPDDTELALKRRLLRKLNSDDSRDSQRSSFDRSRQHRSETGRRRSLERSMCLDLTDADQSPPSDHFLYDNHCYVTPPNSSNDNSDQDRPYVSSDEAPYPPTHAANHAPSSPTSRLLLEYEMHLRNALARGLDAESYSLHTFEALLSQSMENVGGYYHLSPHHTT